MRLLPLALLGPALCSAACPYAERMIESREADLNSISESSHGQTVLDKEGVMLMNRINPSTSQLYIANADGSNERLLLANDLVFEYHASFSPDGNMSHSRASAMATAIRMFTRSISMALE